MGNGYYLRVSSSENVNSSLFYVQSWMLSLTFKLPVSLRISNKILSFEGLCLAFLSSYTVSLILKINLKNNSFDYSNLLLVLYVTVSENATLS